MALQAYRPNVRIGVPSAQVSGAPLRQSAAVMRQTGAMGRELADWAYKRGVQRRVREANEAAEMSTFERAAREHQLRVENPDGSVTHRIIREPNGVILPDLPAADSLSIFDQQYRTAMLHRYVQESEMTARMTLSELATEHRNDPRAFAAAADAYRASFTSELPPDAKAAISGPLRQITLQHFNALSAQKAQNDLRLARETAETNLSTAMNEAVVIAGSGVSMSAPGPKGQQINPGVLTSFTSVNKALNELVSGGFISPAEAGERLRKFSHHIGTVQLLQSMRGRWTGARGELTGARDMAAVYSGNVTLPILSFGENGQPVVHMRKASEVMTPDELTTFAGAVRTGVSLMSAAHGIQEKLNRQYSARQAAQMSAEFAIMALNGNVVGMRQRIKGLAANLESIPDSQFRAAVGAQLLQELNRADQIESRMQAEARAQAGLTIARLGMAGMPVSPETALEVTSELGLPADDALHLIGLARSEREREGEERFNELLIGRATNFIASNPSLLSAAQGAGMVTPEMVTTLTDPAVPASKRSALAGQVFSAMNAAAAQIQAGNAVMSTAGGKMMAAVQDGAPAVYNGRERVAADSIAQTEAKGLGLDGDVTTSEFFQDPGRGVALMNRLGQAATPSGLPKFIARAIRDYDKEGGEQMLFTAMEYVRQLKRGPNSSVLEHDSHLGDIYPVANKLHNILNGEAGILAGPSSPDVKQAIEGFLGRRTSEIPTYGELRSQQPEVAKEMRATLYSRVESKLDVKGMPGQFEEQYANLVLRMGGGFSVDMKDAADRALAVLTGPGGTWRVREGLMYTSTQEHLSGDKALTQYDPRDLYGIPDDVMTNLLRPIMATVNTEEQLTQARQNRTGPAIEIGKNAWLRYDWQASQKASRPIYNLMVNRDGVSPSLYRNSNQELLTIDLQNDVDVYKRSAEPVKRLQQMVGRAIMEHFEKTPPAERWGWMRGGSQSSQWSAPALQSGGRERLQAGANPDDLPPQARTVLSIQALEPYMDDAPDDMKQTWERLKTTEEFRRGGFEAEIYGEDEHFYRLFDYLTRVLPEKNPHLVQPTNPGATTGILK